MSNKVLHNKVFVNIKSSLELEVELLFKNLLKVYVEIIIKCKLILGKRSLIKKFGARTTKNIDDMFQLIR